MITRAVDRDVISADEAAKAIRRFDEMDADEREYVLYSIDRSGDDALELLLGDVCSSPCDSVMKSVEDFVDRREALSDDEGRDLIDAFLDSEDVADGVPGDDPAEVMRNIEFLEEEGVDGLDTTVRDISGTDTAYKGLAGEVEAARAAIEVDNVDPSDISLRDDLSDLDSERTSGLVEGEDYFEDSGESDIDVNTAGERVYESKNQAYEPEEFRKAWTSNDLADDVLVGDLNSLRKKLNTIAAMEDNPSKIIVYVRDTEVDFSELSGKFPSTMDDVESFEDIAKLVESNFDDVDVIFKEFDEA